MNQKPDRPDTVGRLPGETNAEMLERRRRERVQSTEEGDSPSLLSMLPQVTFTSGSGRGSRGSGNNLNITVDDDPGCGTEDD